MKKTVLLLLAVMMIIPLCLPAVSAETSIGATMVEELFSEDHLGKTLEEITADNSAASILDGMMPLNNLYDLDIVGKTHTVFSEIAIKGKNLALQGNHANETSSKNVFSLSNNAAPNAGEGFFTVVPESVVAGLDNFTVSYIERQYEPSEEFGLALFYNSKVKYNGIDYFNGFDSYTFTGFKGNKFQEYSAYSVYGGSKQVFLTNPMRTLPKKNASVFVSVVCTKGTYKSGGVDYTAKIESYVDDTLVATSYAQWADAPIMFYYKTPAEKRWDVQVTNIKVTTDKYEQADINRVLEINKPVEIKGSSVRYSGGDGLRFTVALRKEEVYNSVFGEKYTASEEQLAKMSFGVALNDGTVEKTVAVDDSHITIQTGEQIVGTCAFVGDNIDGSKSYTARAYVKYYQDNKEYIYYSEPQSASCKRTAAKVVAAADAAMIIDESVVDACKAISGELAQFEMMSFNLCVAENLTVDEKALPIAERVAAAKQMLLSEKPDVIGFQEGSSTWEAALTGDAEITAIYDYFISQNSPEHDEEGLYIFYKKDKFRLISSGVKYLSDTPDLPHSEFVDGMFTDNQFYPRKVAYAVLEDVASGYRFAFCNTHLSYNGGLTDTSIGDTLRKKQAEKLCELITTGAMFDSSLPCFAVGDFNFKPNTDPYLILTSTLSDIRYTAYAAAPDNLGTEHGYTGGNTFLDYIFLTADKAYSLQHKILKTKYNDIYPSDHWPVCGSVTILPD